MTLAELKAEIESGPLAADLAPFWADTFPFHPKVDREGILKPDAAFEIHRRLNHPQIAVRSATMPRAEFSAKIAPMVLNIELMADSAKKQQWRDILAVLPTMGDPLTITRPEIQALLDKAVADGLMSQQYRATLADGGEKIVSRAQQLGWSFPYTDVVEAKKVQ